MLKTALPVLMTTMEERDQPEQAKQLVVPSERQTITAKVKDPKKQEAGRKGAAVRRQKLEVLTAKLAAAKTAVFKENNEEHAEASKTSTEGSSGGRSEGTGPGWGVGIGLAVAAAVVLFAVKRVLSFEEAKPLVPAPVEQTSTTSTSCGRAMHNMD